MPSIVERGRRCEIAHRNGYVIDHGLSPVEDDARPNVLERPKGGAERERRRITLYQTMAGAMETRLGREPSPALK
jgi:hypothetical protein